MSELYDYKITYSVQPGGWNYYTINIKAESPYEAEKIFNNLTNDELEELSSSLVDQEVFDDYDTRHVEEIDLSNDPYYNETEEEYEGL